ncbi:helix-turn-helix domain-containing protein [Candidatus Marinarcus aquaticus]|uniref:DNA-binding protein n=1 Tax=Candidatus Marinarcus aquaticus TaxID=2044504 RepID=A0A4Q0XVA5_9BACT|nr:helix-turn-helix domain-containing protein [Candidatus Marinarcus aquaticus]RXJ58113.1 DNA-binding protein [Candidatus Marinarcus aquaticus]
MERLVTTSEAAQLLGLSLQGVHYRIKNGQLKSLKQGGKTFVYVTEFMHNAQNEQSNPKQAEPTAQQAPSFNQEVITEVVKAKDEQISILKQSIAFLKEQYQNEVRRLEKNQKRIIKVFNSEIKLLQSAFNEMRSIYKPQLQQELKSQEEKYISINDFTLYLKQHDKSDADIKKIIVTRLRLKDPRFIYNKRTKKVFIHNTDFSDLL